MGVINVPESCRLLVLAWLIESLRQNTQKPVLEILGIQGSGKSHATEVLRSLIDPSTAMLRSLSKEEDLFVSTQHNWIMTYENTSFLKESQQDFLCQISTGSAYVKRTAYANAEESVLHALRPQIINGITAMATRMDLIDRCVCLELEPMPSEKRKSKTSLAKAFSEAYPRLFGALLQLFSDALAVLPSVSLPNPPPVG